MVTEVIIGENRSNEAEVEALGRRSFPVPRDTLGSRLN